MATYLRTGGMEDRVECRDPLIAPPLHDRPTGPTPRPESPRPGLSGEDCRSLLIGSVTHLLEPDSPFPEVKLSGGGRVCWTDRRGHYSFPLDELEIPLRLTISAPGCIEQVELIDWSPVAPGGLLIRDFQLLPSSQCPVEAAGATTPGAAPGETVPEIESLPADGEALEPVNLTELEWPGPVPGQRAAHTPAQSAAHRPEEEQKVVSLAALGEWLEPGCYLPAELLPAEGGPLVQEVAGLVNHLIEAADESLIWDQESSRQGERWPGGEERTTGAEAGWADEELEDEPAVLLEEWSDEDLDSRDLLEDDTDPFCLTGEGNDHLSSELPLQEMRALKAVAAHSSAPRADATGCYVAAGTDHFGAEERGWYGWAESLTE